jgi:hypothetical protein
MKYIFPIFLALLSGCIVFLENPSLANNALKIATIISKSEGKSEVQRDGEYQFKPVGQVVELNSGDLIWVKNGKITIQCVADKSNQIIYSDGLPKSVDSYCPIP